MLFRKKNPLSWKPTPLPLRALPAPWEDLPSLLCRIAREMGYEDPHWILHPQGSPYRIKAAALPFLSKPEDYLLLQQQLLLDETTLSSLTFHSLAPLLNDGSLLRPTDSLRLHTSTSAFFFLKYPRTRVCPQCLDEIPVYDRIYWRMKYIFFCPIHRVCLRDTCSSCGQPISAFRIDPFFCPSCRQGDYREPIPTPMAEDQLFQISTDLFLQALGITSSQKDDLLRQICPLLTQQPPKAYFSLLKRLMTAHFLARSY